MVMQFIPWGKLANGFIIGAAASVSQHVAKKVQLPERLLAFGREIVPELQGLSIPGMSAFQVPVEAASVGAAAPEAPPIVVHAEAAATADAERQAADAKLAEIEARRRAEEALAEAAAAKAKADAAAKAAGGTKRCVCLTTGDGYPRLSLGGVVGAEGAAGAAGGEEISVGCADDHMCDKCTLNHVRQAADQSPLLSGVELDAVALALPDEVFATIPPVMPMPGQPFDERAYQRDFDGWSRARQAWDRHQATVGAALDDLAQCRQVVNERGRQSISCAQQLEEARAALEAELRAIAALQPSVGQAIDSERQRRGLRGYFSGLAGLAVGQGTPDLIQCQATLADLNLKTQACEAELPKIKAALKVAQKRREELSVKSAKAAQGAREAAERAALEAQAAKAAAEKAQKAAEARASAPASAPATTVMTSYGPVTLSPQAAPQAAAAPQVSPAAPAAPAAPAPAAPTWSLADISDDFAFRTSSEQSAARGREGDYDLDGEIEEVGTVGQFSPWSLLSAGPDDFFSISPPSATVVGADLGALSMGAGKIGCGCG